MEKVYSCREEKKWFTAWEKSALLKVDKRTTAVAFSVMLPPFLPSGSPRMSHALTFTLADIIARRKRMQGFNTLWPAWCDYGGDTAAVKELAGQLGLALDRQRTGFNSAEEMAAVTKEVFVRLSREGYIYRQSPGSKQWFLKTSDIAGAAVKAIERGEITFTPGKWSRLFLDWLKNLKDLCISCHPGQGPQLPAYSCGACQHLMVSEQPPDKCSECGAAEIQAEASGLDPRFFSALCSVAALDRRHNAPDFSAFYPTSLMITGSDTFFLQPARMIILGLQVTGQVPFREILVKDLTGETKSRKENDSQNIPMNPAEMAARYGADALRFTLVIQAGGADVSTSGSRITGSRAFVNKIWNAARFIVDTLKGDEDADIDFSKLTDTDKWILHVLDTAIVKVNDLMDNYRIAEAAHLIYRFVRHEFCDWYLECAKSDSHNTDSRKTLKFTLGAVLRLLHPFMPFITEEIYQKIKGDGEQFLLHTQYPVFHSELVFSHEFSAVEMMKKIVMESRKIRTESKIHPNKRIPIYLKTGSKKERDLLSGNMKYFNALTRSSGTEIIPDFSGLGKGFKGACLNWEILLPVASDEDRMKEIKRLQKELKNIDSQVKAMEKNLSRARFLAKTPEPEVLDLKKKLQAAIGKRNKIQDTIAALS